MQVSTGGAARITVVTLFKRHALKEKQHFQPYAHKVKMQRQPRHFLTKVTF
jgi:hypothetical protein